jgi:hypothetical protein
MAATSWATARAFETYTACLTASLPALIVTSHGGMAEHDAVVQ